jgi:hypothetical protein
MSAKHTPLPWMVFDTPIALGIAPQQGGGDIAWVKHLQRHLDGNSRRSNAEHRANAALIVTAVNHFEELKDKLDDFVGGFAVLHSALKQSNYAADETLMRSWLRTFEEARALLAKLEAEK